MKIYSFIRDQMGLRPVEIEVSLTAGIPKIQYLGLPDALIKESVLRIQSALKHCDYQMPKSKQILVNLKPNYLKKSSLGIDLAVAAGILWETEQEKKPETDAVALYGELTLKGDVLVPDDFDEIQEVPIIDRFFTGPSKDPKHFDLFSLKNLKEISNPEFIGKNKDELLFQRPQIPNIRITKSQAEFLEIIAVGEHPTLFAGPPGTGKTTLAHLVPIFLREPRVEVFRYSQRISKFFKIPITWRPVVAPHHTTTSLALIGGGNYPRPGEITRAHGGALLLDEFLEFNSQVQEALREPLESGKITVSRTSGVKVYPAQFLLLATTNLCPCGYLVPEKDFECRGRVRYCHSLLQKLSGPMMDRFALIDFSYRWGREPDVCLQKTFERIQKAIEFSTKRQDVPNQLLPINEIEETIDQFDRKNLIPQKDNSHRRYNSLLRVARTVADLDFSEKIKIKHIEKARRYSITHFQKIRDCLYKY